MTDVAYRNILCPVDFSETSRKAFFRAVGYAKHFGASLTVLHVREGGDAEEAGEDGDPMTASHTRLEAGLLHRIDELESSGGLSADERSRVALQIRGGKPWLEILRYTVEHDVDLIIMGTHGRTGFRHIFMGSECERVVRRAPCDVLTVKPDGYDAKIELE